MNIFRFIGDMCHLLSFLVLYHKIHRTRSCKGVSPSLCQSAHA
jgi:ER lumen protein retaining receptor